MGTVDIQDMNRFSIKDIENLTGIKAHTIRIWEQRYGILQPKRTTTNIRYYDAFDLKVALRIALLNNYGYKISHIHEMSESEMNSLIQKISDNEFRLQVLVNEMLDATLLLDIDRFESLIQDYIRKKGVEQTIEQLIFSFLEKIGIMWMTDRIIPAQEHMVSNVIYRKLALAIEELPAKDTNARPTVLLFLPEGEIHDIGLMYVYYLLRKYNKNPIYLGANTPLKDVQYVISQKKPDYLYVHLTSVASEFDAGRYLQKLSNAFPDSHIMASGSMLRSSRLNPIKNVQQLHSLQEVRNKLITLI